MKSPGLATERAPLMPDKIEPKEKIRSFLATLNLISDILKEQEPATSDESKYGAVIDVKAFSVAIKKLEELLNEEILESQNITEALFNLGQVIKNSGGIPFGLIQEADSSTHIAMLRDNISRLAEKFREFSTQIDSLKKLFTKNVNIIGQLGILQEAVNLRIDKFTSITLPQLEQRIQKK